MRTAAKRRVMLEGRRMEEEAVAAAAEEEKKEKVKLKRLQVRGGVYYVLMLCVFCAAGMEC